MARATVNEDTYFDMRIRSLEHQREIGKQISITVLISAAWKVATNHPDELLASVKKVMSQ